MSRHILLIAAVLCLIMLGAVVIYARPQQTYTLQRSVMDSAWGHTLQGESYRLNTTVGQPVVGESNAEGAYSVRSGYPPGIRRCCCGFPLQWLNEGSRHYRSDRLNLRIFGNFNDFLRV